jgi:hypothetical protein
MEVTVKDSDLGNWELLNEKVALVVHAEINGGS